LSPNTSILSYSLGRTIPSSISMYILHTGYVNINLLYISVFIVTLLPFIALKFLFFSSFTQTANRATNSFISDNININPIHTTRRFMYRFPINKLTIRRAEYSIRKTIIRKRAVFVYARFLSLLLSRQISFNEIVICLHPYVYFAKN
jgi:hypothetical protein